jgi:catechol 2,3-dioxygenase-like lactoylglutathione lyase family enzyme
MAVKTIALSGAHLESRSLADTVPVLTDLLAFERIGGGPDSVVLKHPNTPWIMTVHEGGADAAEKFGTNHYGVRVVEKTEIDAAYQYLNAHASEYGLLEVREPFNQHGSYSVYFREPGTNTIEIECFEDVNRKAAGIERLGGVRGPHWDQLLPAARFPGRGYVPQALTHGTLAMADSKVSTRFYTEVLGLEAHNAYGEGRVVYVKFPDTRHYIVCITGEERLVNSPSFRYTMDVESPAALEEAHRWLAEHKDAYTITEVHDIQTSDGTSSFLVRDPDLNWWELAARA